MRNAKEIIKFTKKLENSLFVRNPELENIKLFNNYNVPNSHIEKEKYNTIIKTINDDFITKKDCHLIKTNTIDFIPQIELVFSEDMKITKEVILKLKEELTNILEDDDFSIIEINKGSSHFIIALQYIYKKIATKTKQKIDKISTIIKNAVSSIFEKVKNMDFLFYGKKNKPQLVNTFVKDIETEEKKILQIHQENCLGNKINESTNFYELSKAFSWNDLNEVIDYLKLNVLEHQEINQLLKNYGEYYDIFENNFEKALAKSIFEYQLINIYTLDRFDYETFNENKRQCPNVKEQLLFHGTSDENISLILKTFIDIDKNKGNKIGKGFYLSDLFEVSWKYRNHFNFIPKIGDSFSILVCSIYYSESQIQNYYKAIYQNIEVPKNGVRICKANSQANVLSERDLINYDKFIQNEYLISDKSQMLPIYAITLRRVEYLIIWRDNNFDKSNPNNYNFYDFNKMIQFNEEMKNFAFKEINSKIYYVSSSEEGLKLIDRKKYNKIILITNGGNNGRDFIIKAREIIGSNTITLVTCFLPSNHLNWVPYLPNTFLSNEKELFKDFLKNAVQENISEMRNFKNKIEYKYGCYFNQIYENDLFRFPKFMGSGTFDQLRFNPLFNK